mmetsp:Transcript_779/g.2992  ORF Transcript_779/g.2992 Transcript_779/m.2992 type:complete len:201 (+) Transcript_779:1405-2007(+)
MAYESDVDALSVLNRRRASACRFFDAATDFMACKFSELPPAPPPAVDSFPARSLPFSARHMCFRNPLSRDPNPRASWTCHTLFGWWNSKITLGSMWSGVSSSSRSRTEVASKTRRSINSGLSLAHASASNTMFAALSNASACAVCTSLTQPSVTYTSMDRHRIRSCTAGGDLESTMIGRMLLPSLPRSRCNSTSSSFHRG